MGAYTSLGNTHTHTLQHSLQHQAGTASAPARNSSDACPCMPDTPLEAARKGEQVHAAAPWRRPWQALACSAPGHGSQQLAVSPGQQGTHAGVHSLQLHFVCRWKATGARLSRSNPCRQAAKKQRATDKGEAMTQAPDQAECKKISSAFAFFPCRHVHTPSDPGFSCSILAASRYNPSASVTRPVREYVCAVSSSTSATRGHTAPLTASAADSACTAASSQSRRTAGRIGNRVINQRRTAVCGRGVAEVTDCALQLLSSNDRTGKCEEAVRSSSHWTALLQLPPSQWLPCTPGLAPGRSLLMPPR